MTRVRRILLAVIFTGCIIGWIPAAVWTHHAFPAPEVYVFWVALGPVIVGNAFVVGWALSEFYVWAVAPQPNERERALLARQRELRARDERIAALERELEIR